MYFMTCDCDGCIESEKFVIHCNFGVCTFSNNLCERCFNHYMENPDCRLETLLIN